MYKETDHVKDRGKCLMIIVAFFLFFFCIFGIEHAKFQKKNENQKMAKIEVSSRSSMFYEMHIPTINWYQMRQSPVQLGKEWICGMLGFRMYWSSAKTGLLPEENGEFGPMGIDMEMQALLENENACKTDEFSVRQNSDPSVNEAEYASTMVDTVLEEPKKENASIYQKLDMANWQDAALFRERFYTVDPTTDIVFHDKQIEEYLQKDMKLSRDKEGPKVLIYHTHSQEGFADSIPGDPSTTIVGAGEYLATLLEERYGIEVIHETGAYDIESRSTAYSNIQPVLEGYLSQYDSLEVMIDLHRDAIKEGKLLTEIDGKPTARYMLFNGLSYIKGIGAVEYLKNPNIEDNLAFSFQLQYLSEQYYPGLARKIYLKGYRYNLHYLPKSLLIELGAQSNSREEVWNAVECLADLLAKELLGEE